MQQQATKSLIFAIIHSKFQGGEFIPYQLNNILQSDYSVFISESTLVRQLRRWNSEIVAIEPRDRKISRAWTYRIVSKHKV